MIAVSNSIKKIFPPDTVSTSPITTCPTPVNVTVPTMIPATAVATPIPIIFFAPLIRPSFKSRTPSLTLENILDFPLKKSISGFWVKTINIINIDAQNADKSGDNRSTVSNQTSTTIGNK